MRTFVGTVALLGIAALGSSAQEAPLEKVKHCDMKKLEDMLWCSSCWDFITNKDQHARNDLTKDHEVEKAKACVKKYWSCGKCEKDSAQPGKCCDEPRRERTDRSRVVLRCDGCGMDGDRAGACDSLPCQKSRNKIRPMCDKSGTWPHGGDAPKR